MSTRVRLRVDLLETVSLESMKSSSNTQGSGKEAVLLLSSILQLDKLIKPVCDNSLLPLVTVACLISIKIVMIVNELYLSGNL
jgi:hypothetical protein